MALGNDNNGQEPVNKASAAVASDLASPAGAAQGNGNNDRLISVSRGNDSERNEALLTAVREHLSHTGLDQDIRCFPLLAAKYNLRTSGVILAVARTTKKGPTAFYAVLYTESKDLVGYTQNAQVGQGRDGGSATFDFPVTMFDITNKVAQEAAKKCVRDQFPDVARVVRASEFPILTTAAVNGKDADPATIGAIVFNVADALNYQIDLESHSGSRQKAAVLASFHNRTVALKTETNPAPVVDVNGAPIRSDLSFSLTSRENNTGRDAIHDLPAQVGRADAFINLMYFQQPRQTPLQGQLPQMLPPQFAYTYYVPEVHITNLQPQGATNSMEETLLSLLSVTSISDNPLSVLAAAFQPRKTKSVINPRNIGAIGLDLPFINPDLGPNEAGQPFILDTGSADFQSNPHKLMDLIEATVALTPIYLLHVPESGELAYRHRAFLETLANGETGKRARQEIITAMDTLTNGKFSTIWDADKAMVSHTGYRMPMGYYQDDAYNVFRDIRTLDTLALKNIVGAGQPDVIAEWLDALYNQGLDTRTREMKILRVLRHYANGLRITGRAHILNLEIAFLKAARQSLLDAGVIKLVLASNLTTTNDPRARGMADISHLTGNFGSSLAVFNGYQQGQNSGYAGVSQHLGSRWDH